MPDLGIRIPLNGLPDCLWRLIACHPCAGAMLIFSVSFQFFDVSRRSKPIICMDYMDKLTLIRSYAAMGAKHGLLSENCQQSRSIFHQGSAVQTNNGSQTSEAQVRLSCKPHHEHEQLQAQVPHAQTLVTVHPFPMHIQTISAGIAASARPASAPVNIAGGNLLYSKADLDWRMIFAAGHSAILGNSV